jgi:hypothetical protein
MDPSEADKRATVENGVSATPTILSAAQLAAGGAAVSGVMEPFAGLANYAVMWYAQRKLRKITMPITDDMALMKLDKNALTILQSRLQWLQSQAHTISSWRHGTEDPNKMFNSAQTVY